ncbi:MAG TPA: hypothetical protein VIH69_01200 [Dehalococcoidia bacterium]|nr:MAG: hypothetical protein A2Z28_01540 [Chloroflexi bacterium RBG_16_51_9]
MNLSPEMKKTFIDEVRFALKNMKSTTAAAQKWYFFSAIHAMAQRILNLEYEPELAFIFQVFQVTHNMVNARLAALSVGQEAGVGVPDNLFIKIEDEVEKMIDLLEQGKESYPVLQRLVNIAYSTTGNGYYLYLKGMLKI